MKRYTNLYEKADRGTIKKLAEYIGAQFYEWHGDSIENEGLDVAMENYLDDLVFELADNPKVQKQFRISKDDILTAWEEELSIAVMDVI